MKKLPPLFCLTRTAGSTPAEGGKEAGRRRGDGSPLRARASFPRAAVSRRHLWAASRDGQVPGGRGGRGKSGRRGGIRKPRKGKREGIRRGRRQGGKIPPCVPRPFLFRPRPFLLIPPPPPDPAPVSDPRPEEEGGGKKMKGERGRKKEKKHHGIPRHQGSPPKKKGEEEEEEEEKDFNKILLKSPSSPCFLLPLPPLLWSGLDGKFRRVPLSSASSALLPPGFFFRRN